MTAPKRIQLHRTKGWRKPPGAIVVARPSRWGNPDGVGDIVTITTNQAFTLDIPLTAELAVALYRERMDVRIWIPEAAHPDDVAYSQEWRDALEQLRGHDLACWCALDEPCHADVLLELANR